MKKMILLSLTGILFTLISFFGCNKENTELIQTPVVKPNPDSCATVSSKGRIIGWDNCYRYTDSNKVSWSGFLIEIDNGATRDTAASYSIPDGLIQIPPSYYSDPQPFFLFRQEVQDKLKIKFNYRFALENEKTSNICNASIQGAYFLNRRNRKQIFMTCISPL